MRIAGLAVALLPIAFIASCDLAHLQRGYDKAKADYLAQGLPWKSSDMQSQVKEEENLFWSLKSAEEAMPDSGIHDRQAFWDKLAEGGPRPFYAPDLDWGQGRGKSYGYELSFGQRIDGAATLSVDLSNQGKKSESIRLLRSASSTLSTMKQVPSLIHLLCFNPRHLSYAALNCGSQSPGSPERLRDLAESIRPHCSPPNLREVLKGEAFDNLWLCRNLSKLGGWTSLLRVSGNPDRNFTDQLTRGKTFQTEGDVEGVVERSLATKKMVFWTGLYQRLKGVEPGSLDEIDLVAHSAEEALKDQSTSGRMLASGPDLMIWFCDWVRRDLARSRIVRAALLLQAAKAEGRELNSVQDLPKEDWRDPYDGQPIRVAWRDGRVRVWSVGPNGIDDLGVHLPEDQLTKDAKQPGDLVVSLPFQKGASAVW